MPNRSAHQPMESSNPRTTVWIVHRDARRRAALARLVGPGTEVVLGAPNDDLFDAVHAADVVVLAPSGDFELELEFAHRASRTLGPCGWVLIPDAADTAETRRLFDALPAELITYPPSPRTLARVIARAVHGRHAASVSRRRGRDQLAARFGRWFTNLDVPDLLRALDPKLAGLPLLVRGETGSGRGLIARYVHSFGKSSEGAFLSIDCTGATRVRDLLDQLDGVELGSDVRCAIALEHVDALPLSLQHRVQAWLEFGLPEELMVAPNIRWIATAGDESALPLDQEPALADGLFQILAGIEVRIPPLREQPGAVEPFVADTAAAWGAANSQPARSFSAEALMILHGYPWPGNLSELEAVVVRTLSETPDDPILPVHLRFAGGHPGAADTGVIDEPGPAPAEAGSSAEPEAEADERQEGIVYQEPIVVAELEPGERRAADPHAATAQLEPRVPEATTEAVLPAIPAVEAASEAGSGPATPSGTSLRRLVAAIGHEVRDPLTTIRAFANLLPESYDDEEFRERFGRLVNEGVQRIEAVLGRLQDLSNLPEAAKGQPEAAKGQPEAAKGQPEAATAPFDTAELLESLLDARRGDIQARRLLVLKEFDRSHPLALGEVTSLHSAIDGLLTRALSLVPERGDVYLASHHHPAGLRGGPSMRILLRYNNPRSRSPATTSDAPRVEGVSLVENAIEFVVADWVIRSQGGTLVIDTTDSHESVIVIDLPAPSSA